MIRTHFYNYNFTMFKSLCGLAALAAPSFAQSVEDAAELQCYVSNGLTTWDLTSIEREGTDYTSGQVDGAGNGVTIQFNYCSYIDYDAADVYAVYHHGTESYVIASEPIVPTSAKSLYAPDDTEETEVIGVSFNQKGSQDCF